jgi:hypothetical protein
MNWPQIGSQAVSYLIAGVVAAGTLGLAAKFYLDRSLKRLEGTNAKQLEAFRDELNQKRDSRQAKIGQSNYATQKALEIEFKSVQDMYAVLARLRLAMDACRPFSGRVPANETPEQEHDRLMNPVWELIRSRDDLLRLIRTTKLFYPDSIYESVDACLAPADVEIHSIFSDGAPFSISGYLAAQKNREAFYPLGRRAENSLRERLDELKRLPE